MQATLSLQFPQLQKEVTVALFIPLPEQRPRTVANFTFMCTGQIPPSDMLQALRIPPTDVVYPSPAEARADGLLPLRETNVVRVEKGVLVEIGSSTTRSIFGGFLPDERLTMPAGSAARATVASNMMQLKAGTVLCGNVGMPNTNASRYYILLVDMNTPALQEEFTAFSPLGMITDGLPALLRATNMVAVHPRTMTPLKKIELGGCRVDFPYVHLLANPLGWPPAANSAGGGPSQHPRERPTARTRRRDEDDQDSTLDNADRLGGGFFHFDEKFPTRHSKVFGHATKRRRAETEELDAHGRPVLRTTAIGNADEDAADGATFNFFNAQETAFMHDIDAIRDVQTSRMRRKLRRHVKQPKDKSGSDKAPRGISLPQQPAKTATGRKKLSRRY